MDWTPYGDSSRRLLLLLQTKHGLVQYVCFCFDICVARIIFTLYHGYLPVTHDMDSKLVFDLNDECVCEHVFCHY